MTRCCNIYSSLEGSISVVIKDSERSWGRKSIRSLLGTKFASYGLEYIASADVAKKVNFKETSASV
jgi:hypothetical protein